MTMQCVGCGDAIKAYAGDGYCLSYCLNCAVHGTDWKSTVSHANFGFKVLPCASCGGEIHGSSLRDVHGRVWCGDCTHLMQPADLIETTVTGADAILGAAQDALQRQAKVRDKAEGERSMAAIVAAFNGATGRDLTEAEGWAFMVQLKLVRGLTCSDRDSFVDMAAYAALMGECNAR